MTLILLLALAGALSLGAFAFWLRRPAKDPSQEALDLGEGSNLSGHAEAAKKSDPEPENTEQEEA